MLNVRQLLTSYVIKWYRLIVQSCNIKNVGRFSGGSKCGGFFFENSVGRLFTSRHLTSRHLTSRHWLRDNLPYEKKVSTPIISSQSISARKISAKNFDFFRRWKISDKKYCEQMRPNSTKLTQILTSVCTFSSLFLLSIIFKCRWCIIIYKMKDCCDQGIN